ncbi:MAG: YkgJ family cysteine cluster protein [Steroidobacterales bacterium]
MPPTPPDESPPAPELLAIFSEYLNALCDPAAGEALYRMHAADAPVRDGQGIRPAAALDAAVFARTHREISLRGQEVLPRYARALLLGAAGPAPPAADGSVAWFELTELRDERCLIAALGLQWHAGTPRIGWCTLAARVEDWSYRDGLLQSLADYPWMRTAEPAPARALLDASYFRRCWRPPLTFTTLPDARFSCQMSTVCCRHDFEIPLPPEAQLLIDAIPWQRLQPQLVGTRRAVRPDGQLQLKELDETCRFLGPQKQCLIHQTLGRQPFGPCSVFPFAFAQTPEGIAVSLSPICGSMRLGLGVAPLERQDDLRERLAQARPRQAKGFRLAPGTEVSWETFRDVEQALRDCLAADELPMRRRLYVGARLLGALGRNEPIETDRWSSEPRQQISGELREAIRGMLGKILGWDRAVLRRLPPMIPAELCKLEVRDCPIVVRILQNVVYSKVYSYPYDLTTAHNFVIVLYLLTLIMQSASSGPLPDAMWQELGALGVHGLLKSVLHEGVPAGFISLFGTSEFGQWALAA